MPGCSTNDPAVTPAPKPTTSTDFGLRMDQSAGRWPSMRCSRMSCGSVEASTLPLTWNCTRAVAPTASIGDRRVDALADVQDLRAGPIEVTCGARRRSACRGHRRHVTGISAAATMRRRRLPAPRDPASACATRARDQRHQDRTPRSTAREHDQQPLAPLRADPRHQNQAEASAPRIAPPVFAA